MLHNFIFPPEITATIQEKIQILEESLKDPNVQDEDSHLLDDLNNLQQKVNKLSKLSKELSNIEKYKESAILLFVKYFFLEREIIDDYWYLFRYMKGESYIKSIMLSAIDLYKKINSGIGFENLHYDEKYVLKETLKYEIQSLLKANLLINALSEQEINELNLGDMTPQESEAMLISLASTKKWDWVYRNLA